MIERVRRWRWPLVIVLFGLCVLLKLNGSSVAFWTKILHESETQSGLLLFSPKLVRLDEWHAWTPSVVSQARQDSPFPIENPSLGAGRSPLLMSVPVAYYTTFFRPQFWGFFLLWVDETCPVCERHEPKQTPPHAGQAPPPHGLLR